MLHDRTAGMAEKIISLSPDAEASKPLFKAAEVMTKHRLADANNRYLISESLDWVAADWTRPY